MLGADAGLTAGRARVPLPVRVPLAWVPVRGRVTVGAGGRGLGHRLGSKVAQELVPARVDRRRIFLESPVHLFDQPFVLPELWI
ncbi:putative 2-oxoglutarate dehydrogenase domain protein [Mycobacteroides abscessus 21]|uniref:Putative 2-oxoglutarate dehydrogenase domain protein n=1 Tax=Mycobacteroides abscessus 21 TaxID=1299324 RepID=A0A829PZC3_9MYCO|nr:putative 2-oxoglutarate dehydrogenase domain protein [Mycobacteroides abscessus 21]